MRGNGDWATNQRPENWREMILREYPNGDSPITAMTSMMKSEKTNDPTFNWWTKRLAGQSGAVTHIYIDSMLATLYVYATHQATHGVAGAVVYVKMAEALSKEFRIGHQVVLRDDSMYDVDVVGKVVDVVYNGASSYVAVKLLEADDNSATAATYNMASVDRIIICGSIHSEGSSIPRAVVYDPVQYYNYTQIFRSPLEITRTAAKTHLRTGDAVQEAKKEALELHGIELEKALIWGVRTSGTGSNGKPERTFDGILSFIRRNATTTASSIANYKYDADYAGDTWLTSGEAWLDEMFEYLGTYAPSEVTAFCGAGALTGLASIAKNTGHIVMEPGPNDSYGMRFTTWVNPHITVHLKKHPLLSRESSTRYSMILMAPKNIVWRPLDDTQFLADRQERGVDGNISEYLSEIGPELHFPDQFMFLDGVGQNNAV